MAHSTAHTDSAAHLVLSLSCPDRPGIVHAVTGTLARRGGNITESKQFGDSSTGLFFMRVQVLTTVPREELEIDVVGVVGNHETLRDVAEFYGVPFHCIPVTKDTKAEAEAELLGLVDELGVELVVLARYMQILSESLCEKLRGNVINIHHSFLPSFKGAKPYHQAHARGVKLIGATAPHPCSRAAITGHEEGKEPT